MQHWEYRVVSLRDGEYTSALNAYGREGWELVTVATDVRGLPERAQGGGGGVPVPGTLGKLGRAAAKLNEATESEAEQPGAITTTFLWVLRRPYDVFDDVDVDDDI